MPYWQRRSNMFNISLPGKKQILNILWAIFYSFTSTFLSVFTLAGGLQDSKEATVALALSALVSGVNAAIYTVKVTLFDEKK